MKGNKHVLFFKANKNQDFMHKPDYVVILYTEAGAQINQTLPTADIHRHNE